MRAGLGIELRHQIATGFAEREADRAAVAGVRLADDKALGLEPVGEARHRRAVETQRGGEAPDGIGIEPCQRREQPGLRGCHAEGGEAALEVGVQCLHYAIMPIGDPISVFVDS